MALIYASEAIVCFAIAASFCMQLSEANVRRFHMVAHILLGFLYLSLCWHAQEKAQKIPANHQSVAVHASSDRPMTLR